MGLKIGETRCPGCGAMVPFAEGQRQARCEYCGSPVTIEGDWPTESDRVEAETRRVEAEHQKRMREIEFAEREREARMRPAKNAAKVTLFVLSAISMFVAYWFMGSGDYMTCLPFFMLGLILLLGGTELESNGKPKE